MRTTYAVAAIALAMFLGASLAQAQENLTCGDALPIPVDHQQESWVQDDTIYEDRWFKIINLPRRSYCVEAVPSIWMDTPVNPFLSVFENDCATAVSNALTTGPTNDNSFLEPSLFLGSRVCFASAGERNIQVMSCCPPEPNSAPGGIYFLLRVTETTLFSPYWQVVTAASYDAAPQVKNNTSTPVNIYMTVYNENGAPLGACNNMHHQIPADGLFTAGLASHCGISTGFGTMTIAHDGPPGAVSANLTTFSGASGLSFDAAFTVRPKNNPAGY